MSGGRIAAWRIAAYRAARPLLFASDPERIHGLTLAVLRAAGSRAAGRRLCALASGVSSSETAGTPVELMGLAFRNRIGLGAGFDKDAVALRGWAALGLGFVEVGTVTPRPQPGNPRPRLFRLTDDEALVNRMGFNNAGADAAAARLGGARAALPAGFVIGVNVGINRDTPPERAVEDFATVCGTLAPHADYVTLNVSSPNTPGLRQMQRPDRLAALIERAAGAAEGRPILLKLDPDLDDASFDDVVMLVAGTSAAGLILSNTTVHRERLRSPTRLARERGGLSGRPLLSRTLVRVGRARTVTDGRLVIVASGGIHTGDDAHRAFDAGADLVQLWTGLVYRGPGLIGEAVRSSREATPASMLPA